MLPTAEFYFPPLVTTETNISAGSSAAAPRLKMISAQNSHCEKTVRENRPCTHVWNPQGGPSILHIKVPFPMQRKLTVEFSLLCDLHSRVWIDYDSNDGGISEGKGIPHGWKRSSQLKIKKTGKLEQISITLDGCDFGRRINGPDFRIVVKRPGNPPVIISDVTLRRDNFPIEERQIIFEKPPTPKCTVVIPVKDKLELTMQCLAHLSATASKLCNVILVNDNSAALVSKTLRKVEGALLIENTQTLGFAKSCNLGAKFATTEHIVFLDSDTIPSAGWLEPLLGNLESDDQIGVAGSHLITPLSKVIQHAGVAFDELGMPYRLGLGSYNDNSYHTKTRRVAAVTRACLATSKRLFDHLNGFDERYKSDLVGIDFCLRAAEVGLSTQYCGNSRLYKYESTSNVKVSLFDEVVSRHQFYTDWCAQKRTSSIPDIKNSKLHTQLQRQCRSIMQNLSADLQTHPYAFAQRFKLENCLLPLDHYLTEKSLAVVIHVHYIDVFDRILENLLRNHTPYSLYVTTSFDLKQDVETSLLNARINCARLVCSENRGRDVRPFMKLLPILEKEGFEFVLKLHTKKSPHRRDGEQWGQNLITGLIGSANLKAGLRRFLTDPELGLLAPKGTLCNYLEGDHPNQPLLDLLLNQFEYDRSRIRDSKFPAGNMFLARVSALKMMSTLAIADSQFESEPLALDGTIAHAIERVFGVAPQISGYTIADLSTS